MNGSVRGRAAHVFAANGKAIDARPIERRHILSGSKRRSDNAAFSLVEWECFAGRAPYRMLEDGGERFGDRYASQNGS